MISSFTQLSIVNTALIVEEQCLDVRWTDERFTIGWIVIHGGTKNDTEHNGTNIYVVKTLSVLADRSSYIITWELFED